MGIIMWFSTKLQRLFLNFASLNVLYVYIDKVHITMTYKKTYPDIIHGTFEWSSSLLWTSCIISLEGSPYIFHRQHLKASHLFKYVCVLWCFQSHLQYYYSPCVFVCSQSSIILINILPSISTTNSLFRFCFLQIICHEKTT